MVKKCTGHQTAHSPQWHQSILTGPGQNPLGNINNNLFVIAHHSGDQNTHFRRTLKVKISASLSPSELSGSKQHSSLQAPSLNNLWLSGKTYLHIFTWIIKQKEQKIQTPDLFTTKILQLSQVFFIPGVTSWTKAFSYHTILVALLVVLPSAKSSRPPTFNDVLGGDQFSVRIHG